MKITALAKRSAAWAALAASFAFLTCIVSAPAWADSCTTSSPVNLPVVVDALTAINNGGAGDGTYNLKGTANCPGYASALAEANERIDQSTAVAAALSTPVWLEARENFAISGGLGFTDGATALGATGVVRLGKNMSAFAGGAMSTEDSDAWAGRVGGRVGF